MYIQDGIMTNKENQFIGFLDDVALDDEIWEKQLEFRDDKQLLNELVAKTVMVVGVQFIHCAGFVPILYVPTNTMPAKSIFTYYWRCVEALERNDFRVLSMSSDGASVLRQFRHMCTPVDEAKPWLVKNRFSREQLPLAIVPDSLHNIKKIRNQWMGTDGKLTEQSKIVRRRLRVNGGDLDWDILRTLEQRDRDGVWSGAYPRLTNKHINPQATEKMSGKLATDLISKRMLDETAAECRRLEEAHPLGRRTPAEATEIGSWKATHDFIEILQVQYCEYVLFSD